MTKKIQCTPYYVAPPLKFEYGDFPLVDQSPFLDLSKQIEQLEKEEQDQNREKEKLLLTFSSLIISALLLYLGKMELPSWHRTGIILFMFPFASCVLACLIAYQSQIRIAKRLTIYLGLALRNQKTLSLKKIYHYKRRLRKRYKVDKWRNIAGLNFIFGIWFLPFFLIVSHIFHP